MMEVILREDVKSLGNAGDLVRVKPGYARNFLLPKGFAYQATQGNKKRIEAEAKARNIKLAADKVHAEALATQLSAVAITLARKAGEIQPDQPLSGWLYHTTRYQSLNASRAEGRRRHRETVMGAKDNVRCGAQRNRHARVE